MSTHHQQAKDYVERLLAARPLEQWLQRLAPKEGRAARLANNTGLTDEAVDRRYAVIEDADRVRPELMDPWTAERRDAYANNIENFIGTVKVPVGLAGPLRVNGLFAQGDFFLPLATTEAALVASYSRGAQAITECGGCAAMLITEGVPRAPGFAFNDLREAGAFLVWCTQQMDEFRKRAEATTRHGKLLDVRTTVEGNHVYLSFEYRTGDAAGQNMVTIATQAICNYIVEASPVKPRHHFVEANLSGDKKATAVSFLSVRGKKVTAEVRLAGRVVERRLHTTPRKMVDYYQMSSMGSVLSGSLGIQGHFANGLAALFIACGQDAACVAESAVGTTRLEVVEGDLYAAVTLPNLIVGTVGGGTGLPTQAACLDIMKLRGPEKARPFAEVCAGMALAGELSIIAALSCGAFTRAHEKLARRKGKAPAGSGA